MLNLLATLVEVSGILVVIAVVAFGVFLISTPHGYTHESDDPTTWEPLEPKEEEV